jgi:hypothetical protein
VNTTGSGTPGGPAGPGGKPSGPAASVKGKLSIKSIAKKGLAVTVPCTAACKVSVSLVVSKKTVATGKTTMLKAGDAKLTLKVSKKAKKSFSRLKKARATLKVTVQDASGKASSSKSLKLKR